MPSFLIQTDETQNDVISQTENNGTQEEIVFDSISSIRMYASPKLENGFNTEISEKNEILITKQKLNEMFQETQNQSQIFNTNINSLSNTNTHPNRANIIQKFNWIPRYQLAKDNLDAIVTFKENLVNIKGTKFSMNENDAQIPQIVVSDVILETGKCYYWEMKITIGEEALDDLFGDLIEIGVLNVDRSSWELENISDQQFGWCLFADGCIGHNDEETQYIKKELESGNRIGVLCNLKNDCSGILSFFVNDISCGIAYSNITGPVRAAISLVQPSIEIEVLKFEERK